MKAIKSILAFVVIMTLSFGVKAQDKYEYASVIFEIINAQKGYIYISDGEKYETRMLEIKGGEMGTNLNPVLTELNKMNENGWEVINTNWHLDRKVFYHLRKRKG